MAGRAEDNNMHKAGKRKRNVIRILAAVCILIAVVAFVYSRIDSPTVDERLAVFEAARAIPDSENAATVYDHLLQDPNAMSLLDHRPEFFDDEMWNQTYTRPWLSTDYPELATWINDHQYIIDRLFEAVEFEKCRFPIIIDIQQTDPQFERIVSMRQWAILLRFAANNDLAKGRIDSAITKWRSIFEMADHMRQQPTITDQLCADNVERIAWLGFACFLVEDDPQESHFRQIQAMTLPTVDGLDSTLEDIRLVKALADQKYREDFGLFAGLMLRMSSEYGSDEVRRGYMRTEAITRGIRILIALRRHKNEFGAWPGKLDDIQSELSAEVLVDPLNKGEFAYKLTDDGFRLYSKGENSIDEDGKYKTNGPDDRLIWPPRGYRIQSETSENK
ncbi:MAG: hypothetical protein ACYTE3_22260 [Planctomycetota bacterium]|jgi:hypothetical protein